MPKLRLTKTNIEAIVSPARGQALYYDTALTGFGIRVGQTRKVFFCEAKVRGRTVRPTIGPYGAFSPEEAAKLARRQLADMSQGINPNEAKRVTEARAVKLKAAFDEFFEARPNFSPKTIPTYRRTIDLYLKDWQGRPVGDLTRQMVLARHRLVAERHGSTTANNVMRHLRSVYNYVSAAHGELPPNPVCILSQARSWGVERRRRNIVPQHALPQWFKAVYDEHTTARDYMLVALMTGMRRGEVATLRWEHIDLVGETLTVPFTKNGEPLTLPLSWYLVDLFIARRTVDPEGEWVFAGAGKTGHIVETKSFTSRTSVACGVKFTLHDLRRTFVTIAESLDIPAYALKRLLNHRIENDVTGGYIVIDAERLRGPVNRIADKILELANERGTVQSIRAA
jgi:integrase